MLDEVNDEEQHAHQLGKLLETFQVVRSIFQITACRNSASSCFCYEECAYFSKCGLLIS